MLQSSFEYDMGLLGTIVKEPGGDTLPLSLRLPTAGIASSTGQPAKRGAMPWLAPAYPRLPTGSG